MILGASYSQIPLYETASRLGIGDMLDPSVQY